MESYNFRTPPLARYEEIGLQAQILEEGSLLLSRKCQLLILPSRHFLTFIEALHFDN